MNGGSVSWLSATRDVGELIETGGKWEGAHRHAPAEGAPFPDPHEIQQDIGELDGWAKGIWKRGKW